MDDLDRVLLAVRCTDETGLRLADVLALPADSFDAASGALAARLSDAGRAETRRFALSRLLCLSLSRLVADARCSGSTLFCDTSGRAFTPAGVRALWSGRAGAPGSSAGGSGTIGSVAARWTDDCSSRYVAARRERQVRAALDRALFGKSRPRVLEVGCGYGGLLQALHGGGIGLAGGWSIGIDRVPEIAAAASRSTPRGLERIAWVVADAGHLPVAAGSIDVVLCLEVLEHFPIPQIPLAAIGRCLRPGGRLIATTPSPSGAFVRLARLRRWSHSFAADGGLGSLRQGYVPMVDPREEEKAMVYGHVSARSPSEWERTFAEIGLRLFSARPISVAAPNLLFDRHPAALSALRMADALMTRLPGAAAFCTEICYEAGKA